MFTWTAVGVFLAMIFTDIVWTAYIKTIADGEATAAAFWAMLVMLIGAFVTIQYVNDPAMLVPAGLGGAVGTWIAVKFWTNKEDDEDDGTDS